MALLCNDVEMRGKQIWCIHTGEPCVFVRYCANGGRYYQTDQAKACKMKGKCDGDKRQND